MNNINEYMEIELVDYRLAETGVFQKRAATEQ